MHRRVVPCCAVECPGLGAAHRAPPAPPAPAGSMSAGEAKEYLARREIPQLFEVGEAEGVGAFSAPSGGCFAPGPIGGQRAEGGWKDGAARGCGARTLRGEPRRGRTGPHPGPGALPGDRGLGAAWWELPAAEVAREPLPPPRASAGALAAGRPRPSAPLLPPRLPSLFQPPGEGTNLSVHRAEDPQDLFAEECRRGLSLSICPDCHGSGLRNNPHLFREVLFSFL